MWNRKNKGLSSSQKLENLLSEIELLARSDDYRDNKAILYKEKINTVTGKTEVQCDKLYDYRMISLKEVEILKNSGLPFVMKKVDENRGIIRFEKRNAVKVNKLIEPPSQLELGTKPPNQNNPKR